MFCKYFITMSFKPLIHIENTSCLMHDSCGMKGQVLRDTPCNIFKGNADLPKLYGTVHYESKRFLPYSQFANQ